MTENAIWISTDSHVAEPYRTAGRDGRLRVQRCGSCRARRHPPSTTASFLPVFRVRHTG